MHQGVSNTAAGGQSHGGMSAGCYAVHATAADIAERTYAVAEISY